MRRFLFIVFLGCGLSTVLCSQEQKPVDLVDPFIGTGGHGHTFPGATRPFGMVQLSPDTRIVGWDACGGYHYSDRSILGFSHTHLSGTGVGDYGDILFAPMVGAVRLDSGSVIEPGYRSSFSHDDEVATPGYYSVALKEKRMTVELTTTRRTGYHRYTFPETDSAWIVIDLVHGIGPDVVLDASLEVTGVNEVVGFRRSKGWALDQHVYFVAQFSQPIASFGMSGSDVFSADVKSVRGRIAKAGLRFVTRSGEPVVVRVGISATDIEGARRNLLAEADHWNFDAIREDAREEWSRSLSRISVSGGTLEQERTFYTALYHSFIAPNVFSDVDGRYRTMTGGIDTAEGFERYTVFSLWDTFRAAHPLFTILEPDRTNDFIRSFLAIYDESSYLPVWELAANETWCMIGYHAVPPIVDAYAKGIRGFDAEHAFEAMRESAMKDHFGMGYCRVSGFVPAEKESESVSKTLEYAFDDWCVSEMARLLGKEPEQRLFATRAESYRNLFDERVGFFRGKKNGAWKEPFSPRAVTIDFTEANAWQYTFFVPHNVSGMMELYGGRTGFAAKLDQLFTGESDLEGRDQADITGLIGQYAHGNEPSHHIAYLYASAGQPWKTQELVRRIMDEFYTDKPDGLIGNEDCGQMSAWYVLSALGLYPVNPAQPVYTIGTPRFPEARIQLPNGNTFTVVGEGVATKAFVGAASLKGEPLDRAWITHEELVGGGRMEFALQDLPNKDWASTPDGAPPTPSSGRIVLTPVSSQQAPSFEGSMTVGLSCATPDAIIRYTLDGSEPGSSSHEYVEPITLTSSTTMKARAFRDGWPPSGIMEARYERFERIGKVMSTSAYSPQYTAGGDQAVVDGIRGLIDFRVGGWQGYEERDMNAVIDLGELRDVATISATFLHDNNAWIFFPQSVTYELSEDGEVFEKVFRKADIVPADRPAPVIRSVTFEGDGRMARYVRVTATNIGRCPPWHKGEGGKAWIFIDEVEVR